MRYRDDIQSFIQLKRRIQQLEQDKADLLIENGDLRQTMRQQSEFVKAKDVIVAPDAKSGLTYAAVRLDAAMFAAGEYLNDLQQFTTWVSAITAERRKTDAGPNLDGMSGKLAKALEDCDVAFRKVNLDITPLKTQIDELIEGLNRWQAGKDTGDYLRECFMNF